MQESDPNMLRYEAIEQVLDGMPEDFPYMIYSFSNDVQKIRDMRPISDGVGEIPSESNGGTSIRGALNRVLDDYKDKIWQDDQRRTKVILLTDGYATDIGFFRPIGRTLKKFAKAHISVSTVGLGQVDTKLMEKIAETTDGVFLQAEDAALLKDAMTSAARQYSEVRNLLSVRAPQEKDWLYGMMRVLFLTLLGTGIGCMMIFASTKEEDAVLITVSSAAKSLAGALLMEILVQGAGVSANVMWLILWLLIAALISRVEETIGRYAGGSGRSSNISGYTSGSGRSSNISRY